MSAKLSATPAEEHSSTPFLVQGVGKSSWAVKLSPERMGSTDSSLLVFFYPLSRLKTADYALLTCIIFVLVLPYPHQSFGKVARQPTNPTIASGKSSSKPLVRMCGTFPRRYLHYGCELQVWLIIRRSNYQ